jgi:hypothetical protein
MIPYILILALLAVLVAIDSTDHDRGDSNS